MPSGCAPSPRGRCAAIMPAMPADIASAGRHLLALVDDLVDLQAIERPDFRPEAEPIDLADIARRAAGLLSRARRRPQCHDRRAGRGRGPARDRRFHPRPPDHDEPDHQRRSATRPKAARSGCGTEREGDLAAIIVADQGKGIAEEDQERIFDRFERVDPTEPGGTGLGLYIARRLARFMGGDIAVDSAPGPGRALHLHTAAARRPRPMMLDKRRRAVQSCRR